MVWRNERKREGGGGRERVKGDSYTISHVAIIGIVMSHGINDFMSHFLSITPLYKKVDLVDYNDIIQFSMDIVV